jgi:hypothetical protein
MIATKTTALMLALGMLGIAGMMFVSPSAYAQSNTAVANNEDNDVVVQSNEAKIKQEQSVKCDAEAEGSIAVNVASNDCDRNDQDQDATVLQSNDNDDNDVQVANAEAEQSVCGQLAFLGLQVCGNEEE